MTGIETSGYRAVPAFAPSFPIGRCMRAALNKIPLVKWERGAIFVSSTHALLPRRYNLTYDNEGGEKLTGALLHTKFLSTMSEKVSEEVKRGEHFAGGREYRAYSDQIDLGPEPLDASFSEVLRIGASLWRWD